MGLAILVGILFAIFYVVVLKAGSFVVDKTIDAGVDAAEKATKTASEKLTPIASKAMDSMVKAKNAILKPYVFSETWRFKEFYMMNNRPRVSCQSNVNDETGELYHIYTIHISQSKEVEVRCASSPGDLTPEKLNEIKEDLYIGKTNNGKYYFFDDNFKEWEDVPLDI